MNKVFLYSFLILIGLVFSQIFDLHPWKSWTNAITMIFLAYVMIEVGIEFNIDRTCLKSYGKDYLIAMTAAALPWIFCAAYFIFFFHLNLQESLLIARFAAPTSAGVLFTMLAAAGLAGTWVYQKARLLAIFDDLDTILLMIPLQIMLIGFKWEMLFILIVSFLLVWLAYRFLHSWDLPTSTVSFLIYSLLLWAASALFEKTTGFHFEILLPSFCLGCLIKSKKAEGIGGKEKDHKNFDADHLIKSCFMFLVGLSLPLIMWEGQTRLILIHVVVITLISNLGKCFPLFCYRQEASFKERVALSISLFPRGEVGGGILAISMIYQLNSFATSVSGVSLAANLLLTGFFIFCVKKLTQKLV